MTNQHNFTDIELQTSIRDMVFSTRTRHALLGNGINTLKELLDVMDCNRLGDLHLIGSQCIKEINSKVAEMQTTKYRDFKENMTAAEQRKKDIDKQIKQYKNAIMKLENEQKYNDQVIIKLKQTYEKTLRK